jgi:hypothetical protein
LFPRIRTAVEQDKNLTGNTVELSDLSNLKMRLIVFRHLVNSRTRDIRCAKSKTMRALQAPIRSIWSPS